MTDLFYRFGVALAIGFVVGLQREYTHGGPSARFLLPGFLLILAAGPGAVFL